MTCGPPGLVRGSDDATWFVEHGYVVMHRLDGREFAVPLQQGSCAACVAQFLFMQSTEMSLKKRKKRRR